MVLLANQRDKRSFPRIDFHSEIRYQLRGKPVFDYAMSNDISSGGLRLTCNSFIPASTAVMLEVNILNRVLRPIGRVAWLSSLAHSSRSQIGLEFVEFDLADQNYLKDFINLRLD